VRALSVRGVVAARRRLLRRRGGRAALALATRARRWRAASTPGDAAVGRGLRARGGGVLRQRSRTMDLPLAARLGGGGALTSAARRDGAGGGAAGGEPGAVSAQPRLAGAGAGGERART